MVKKSKKRNTAKELKDQLESDPQFAKKMKEKNSQLAAARFNTEKIVAPILIDLETRGISVDSLDALRQSGTNYREAVPILLRWIPKIDDLGVKESIVRTLSVPWAKSAALPLLHEFWTVPYDSPQALAFKWAIGNALSVIGDDSVFEEVVKVVKDRTQGPSRQMFVVALGKMKNPKATDVLVELLNDEKVCGHAILALGNLRARAAVPYIEKFLNHKNAWIRKEAKDAISKIQKRA